MKALCEMRYRATPTDTAPDATDPTKTSKDSGYRTAYRCGG
jgi:hypothetical protein